MMESRNVIILLWCFQMNHQKTRSVYSARRELDNICSFLLCACETMRCGRLDEKRSSVGEKLQGSRRDSLMLLGTGGLLGIVGREAGVEGIAVTSMKTKLFDDIGKELWDNAELLTNIAAASIKYKSGTTVHGRLNI